MIELRRAQLSLAEGLFAEEVGDLWEDWMRHQMPLRVVFTTASTMLLSTYGHLGHALSFLTGSPPRIANLPAFRVMSA